MSNRFAHIELSTTDVRAAKKFYKKLFDWTVTDMPGMSYTLINTGEGDTAGGGMSGMGGPDSPRQWLPYVKVDSVKKTLGKAEKNGAKVTVPFTSLGDMGAMGVFVDPGGAALGIWEEGKAAQMAGKKPAKASKTDKKASRSDKKASKSDKKASKSDEKAAKSKPGKAKKK